LFRVSLIILIFLSISDLTFGQKKYSLKVFFTDTAALTNDLRKDYSEQKFYNDTNKINEELESILNKLKGSGYISAGIDSLSQDSLNTHAFIYTGGNYKWTSLRQGNVPEDFLQGTGYRKKIYLEKPFQQEQFSRLSENIIRNCENNGYPFAVLKLDSIELNDGRISASMNLNKNKLVYIDSIIIQGTSTIAPVYLYNYIAIKPGDIYRENQIKRISGRMRELPFIKEAKPSQILFGEKETKLYMFLENKKASQFDGVLGLLPDENKTGKFNLTGEVHLKLQNSLKRGEIIELNWKQLPFSSQDLKFHTLYPFIFNTPFGIDGHLAIFKKDSTYIDVTKNLGVQYAFTGNNYLKAFINDKQSDLQSARGLENITTLPEYADITTISYGVTVHYEKLDYRLNPRSGFWIEATGSTGNRKIRKNSDINDAVYDSIKLNTVTYQGEIISDYYYPLGGRHVLDLGANAGYIYNSELFLNELYRIGGLRSLRGFDEESIYASIYIIGKLEYRYLLEQNSFLFAFINNAWYENKSRHAEVTDTPIGFGTGINFETRLGIMSVSYALGKQFDNPVFFKNAKVHFGIVNYF
jgi:outer membrane protein assembly factor BamA